MCRCNNHLKGAFGFPFHVYKEKTMEPEYELHNFHFPFSNLIFGKNFPMVCEVLFEYAQDEENRSLVRVKSLIGRDQDGRISDLSYLTEDTSSRYSMFIIGSIVKNKWYWDYQPIGDKEWWE